MIQDSSPSAQTQNQKISSVPQRSIPPRRSGGGGGGGGGGGSYGGGGELYFNYEHHFLTPSEIR